MCRSSDRPAQRNKAPTKYIRTPATRHGSPPTTTVQDEKAAREAKAAELLKKLKAKKEETPVINEKKPEPTQFYEPDANSLLYSFGF